VRDLEVIDSELRLLLAIRRMARHACPRCGLESRCSHGSWVDRHPVAAVTGDLFGLMWMSMMLSIRIRCLDGNSCYRLGRLCGGS
jgi:hypothetical protein